MFSMTERKVNKHKFAGTKVCETEKVREHFINPKIQNEDFGWCVNQVIRSLGYKNISCSTSEKML